MYKRKQRSNDKQKELLGRHDKSLKGKSKGSERCNIRGNGSKMEMEVKNIPFL